MCRGIPLTMSSQRILSGKTLPTSTDKWFIPSMDLFMSPQIMLSHKPSPTNITAVWPIRQMSLYVRLDVVLPPETFPTVRVETLEFMVMRVWSGNITLHCRVWDIALSLASILDWTVVDVGGVFIGRGRGRRRVGLVCRGCHDGGGTVSSGVTTTTLTHDVCAERLGWKHW